VNVWKSRNGTRARGMNHTRSRLNDRVQTLTLNFERSGSGKIRLSKYATKPNTGDRSARCE
jgi:hypothetical protein